ncbi:MAG: hypothetical protein U5R46_12000 [Gammaproteobacteria bacterium]|nr:hypothetical protein [Gammaproteobacteria bacterium]
MTGDNILDHLPKDLILSAYRAAPGNEIESGKFESPESSAALAANAFGFFLEQPHRLPPIPSTDNCGWPATSVRIEANIRFPWRGGYHPWLDAFIETSTHVIGVESKRYEPFRSKSPVRFSDTYWRDVWGPNMGPYLTVRDDLASGTIAYRHLDAAQLVKHALALAAEGGRQRKAQVLLYLFAEPPTWPDDREVSPTHMEAHRAEVVDFAQRVSGASVGFVSCRYRDLLAAWQTSGIEGLDYHARAVSDAFTP